MKKDYIIFLKHMLKCIMNIEEDTKNLTKEDFMLLRTITNSVLWNMEVMGEAAKNIPPDVRIKYHKIPWRDIAGMRDKLIHEYFGIDLGNVWKVIKEDIPLLKNAIEEIIRSKKKR